MHIKQFLTGGDRNFAYLVGDEATKKAIVIDPSYDPDSVVDYACESRYEIVGAFNTHGHHDHTNGNNAFEKSTGVRPAAFGQFATNGVHVDHETVFPVGELEARILHTPGHSPDSICILVGDAVFTGDTLFVGKVGGTDLDEGARTEYASLHDIVLKLPDATRVFPGHDVGVAPESTIGHEKETNPFLLRKDVESFIDLKRNWAAYKKEHGIA